MRSHALQTLFKGIAAAALVAGVVVALPGGPAARAALPSGNALRLNGTNAYASASDSSSLDLGTAGQSMTIEAFVYVPDESSDANQVIFWKQYAYALSINFNTATPDVLLFDVWSSPTSFGHFTLSVQHSMSVGWHHIAAEYDNQPGSAADGFFIYIDGSQVAANTSAVGFDPGLFNATNTLSVGANAGAAAWNGWIDEARFSSAVKYTGPTYTVPTAPFTTDSSTRALWHFDDPVCASSFADSSGNGNTLTAHNGAQTAQPGAPAPSVQFSATDYTVNEDVGSATITVDRTGDTSSASSVGYATADGTATAGSDYVATSGTLNFACGQESATFGVQIIDDDAIEGDETVQLSLNSPSEGTALGSPASATLTITNNDFPAPAVVAFSQPSLKVSENAGTVNLTVTRTGNTDTAASVHYARTSGSATPGSDFTLSSGTLTFADSQTTASIPLTIVNDSLAEPAETIVVMLSDPADGTELGTPASMTVTINASDQRPDAWISNQSASGYVGNDIFNSTGAGQTKSQSAPRGQTRTFYVRVYNDGQVKNSFAIRGSKAATGSSVRYFAGTADVTTAMRSSAGLVVSLKPGAYKLIKVQIKIGSTAAIGSAKSATVSAEWRGDSVRTDLVKASVKVTR